jgi:threonine dehydrogenase-like Zn-dependent dehydrogenase
MSMPLVRVHGVDDVRLDTVEKPTITADDVLVQVSLCGICGSDLGYITMGGLGLTQPMPLGHELVGTVVEVGDNVDHLDVGDRVVVNPMAAGNSIGNGGTEGAFAPYLMVRCVSSDRDAALKIPESLTMEQAAMVEPLSVKVSPWSRPPWWNPSRSHYTGATRERRVPETKPLFSVPAQSVFALPYASSTSVWKTS